MGFINALIDNYNIPILSAFLLGVLASVSPCPLATNITAITYISKEIKSAKRTLLNGLAYTLGRGISYATLAMLIYFGLSSFRISGIFQGWGDKALGVLLIVIGLIMFGIIKINIRFNSERLGKIKEWLSKKGFIGSLLLGIIFSLAFCPYSGVLFFGVLVPLAVNTRGGLLLPLVFAFGAGLPVIIFSFLLAFCVGKVSKMFNAVQRFEKIMRYTIATVFLLTGAYYLQFLFKYLII